MKVQAKVKNGEAIVFCPVCKAEQKIIQRYLYGGTDWIDDEKTIEMMQSFATKHALCKNEVKQLTILE